MYETSNSKIFIRLVSLLTLLFLFAACSSEEGGREGVKIVPVFGPERIDVSSDVDWRGTKVGTIGEEQRTDDGELFGLFFESKFDALGEEGLYDIGEGEIGVQLSFNNINHYSKYTITADTIASGMLEVELTDFSRIIIEAQGLEDDALTELTIDTPKRGSTTRTTGWVNLKGAHYVKDSGRYVLRLINTASNENRSEEVVLGNNDTATVTFKFCE